MTAYQRDVLATVLQDMAAAAPLNPADRNSGQRVVGAERVRGWQLALGLVLKAEERGSA